MYLPAAAAATMNHAAATAAAIVALFAPHHGAAVSVAGPQVARGSTVSGVMAALRAKARDPRAPTDEAGCVLRSAVTASVAHIGWIKAGLECVGATGPTQMTACGQNYNRSLGKFGDAECWYYGPPWEFYFGSIGPFYNHWECGDNESIRGYTHDYAPELIPARLTEYTPGRGTPYPQCHA